MVASPYQAEVVKGIRVYIGYIKPKLTVSGLQFIDSAQVRENHCMQNVVINVLLYSKTFVTKTEV